MIGALILGLYAPLPSGPFCGTRFSMEKVYTRIGLLRALYSSTEMPETTGRQLENRPP